MNFRKAKSKLKKIAGGRYHSLRYSVTEYSATGDLSQECAAYIEKMDWYTGATWGLVFEQIEQAKVTVDSIEEIKEEEEDGE